MTVDLWNIGYQDAYDGCPARMDDAEYNAGYAFGLISKKFDE